MDSNALVMPSASLERIGGHAYRIFPDLERIILYACASDILRKRDEHLTRIRRASISLLYIGLESGSDTVLSMHNKGATALGSVQACRRAVEAGFTISITVILGLGGKEKSREHAGKTAEAVSRIEPAYLGALTLMVVPATPLDEWVRNGTFKILRAKEILEELEQMLIHTEVERPMVLRTNHASNCLPLKGTLPKNKDRLLAVIRQALEQKIPLRPEHLRGL